MKSTTRQGRHERSIRPGIEIDGGTWDLSSRQAAAACRSTKVRGFAPGQKADGWLVVEGERRPGRVQ
ncbi:hypothetical protein [Rhodocyclus purpureus]|uniref:hypothetical protein n=1 Tax=Rhodocyclus purpureus TaxID=1067 RepID=UPI0019125E4B|nr:hypothetical protein [Rhodocyclus purpureus]